MKRSYAANSLFYFGIYLFIAGPIFIFYPEPLAALAGLNLPVDPGWRVVGLLMFIIGLFDFQVGRKGNMPDLYIITIIERILAFSTLSVFVLLKFFNYVGFLFGLVDLLGAIWTIWAIQKDKKSRS